ncbi:helix-turn-helix domain-containing protein [Perlucidibaca piscinae]|uniref:helix-turn-helix domain-containing protein n=1 Tax=Perlucidibaca piscinae TaxID=392589 RepID=UPI0003B42A15|nr:AraC family transcriptional regulator [Perlucidibaca piscinae]
MGVALKATEGVLVGHYVLFTLRFMHRRGFSAEQILHGTSIRLEDLEQYPDYLVSLPALLVIVQNLHDLDPSPSLPFELGSQLKLGNHGFLGYAVQASANLGEALALVHRYTLTRTQFLQLQLGRQDSHAILEISDNGMLGSWFPRIIELLLASFFTIGNDLLGNLPLQDTELQLSFSEQPHHLGLRAITGNRIRFDCASTAIRFPAVWLAITLPSADPQLVALAASRCRDELEAAERSVDLVTRIRRLMQKHLAEPHAQELVASTLNMTPRTLHRRLQEQGMHFKTLMDETRRSRATFKLRHETVSIGEIAAELGYSDQANFVRAFKRWTGKTPSEFRKES